MTRPRGGGRDPMPTLPDILARVTQIDDATVDQALAAALPTAGTRAQDLIARAILARSADAGRLALVQSFHTLAPDLQDVVARQGQSLYPVLSQAIALRQSRGQMNVAMLVRAGRDPRLAGLLTSLLRHGDAAVLPVAAEALLELALACRRAEASGPEPQATESVDPLRLPAAALTLQAAIDEALAIYHHHRQPAVLEALLLMSPRPMPLAARILSDRGHPAVAPVRDLLSKAQTAAARRAAVPLSRLPGLTAGALAGVIRAAGSARLGDVIAGGSHLLHAGPIARAMAHLPDPARLCPIAGDVAAYPPALAAAAPGWIAGLSLEPGQKVAVLATYARAAHPAARLAALRRLMALSQDRPAAALDAIASFSSDPDPALARIALRHLIRCRWSGLARLLLALVHSPHDEIRQLASGHLAPLGFQRFWDAWPRLDLPRQLAAGRALVKIDPSFPRLLSEKLARQDRADVLRALQIIHTLHQGAIFEQPLAALARSPDEVIAASAVRTLGSGETEMSLQAIEGALNHADSRVRANAIEALEQRRSTRHVQKLVQMAETDDNRPRANAIRVLLSMRTGDALAALARMLDDPHAPHRVSALWLVDQLGLVQVARHVAEMSITDPDRDVKRRAHNVIHHLIEAMRLSTDPAPATKAG